MAYFLAFSVTKKHIYILVNCLKSYEARTRRRSAASRVGDTLDTQTGATPVRRGVRCRRCRRTRLDAENAWSDAAQKVDTRVQTRPNQIFYYLFKKYLPKTKITSSPCRKRTSTSPPPFPPLQVSPSFFSEFSHDLICSIASMFLSFLSSLCCFPVPLMLLPGFMVSKFLISIDAFVLYGFWFYGILSLSLSMCSGTQYPMPCALVTREFIFIILFR